MGIERALRYWSQGKRFPSCVLSEAPEVMKGVLQTLEMAEATQAHDPGNIAIMFSTLLWAALGTVQWLR